MTEDEAKTKWCPHVRGLAASVGAAPNRTLDGSRHRSADCIGSACMSWRWIVDPKLYADMAYDPTNGIRTAGGPTGYCGLAGKP